MSYKPLHVIHIQHLYGKPIASIIRILSDEHVITSSLTKWRTGITVRAMLPKGRGVGGSMTDGPVRYVSLYISCILDC